MPWNAKKQLNKYILMTGDHPEKDDLFIELKRNITSPKEIAEFDFLTPDSILKKEAIIISDAFEAMTNGMINDEIMEQLVHIGEESLFYSWKVLIEGLHAFYSRDLKKCREKISAIPGDTAPHCFKEMFQSVFGQSESEDWTELMSSILESNTEIQDSLDLLKEASGMEDILLDTASLLIRDLIRDDPVTCEKIMVWCLDHLQLTDVLSDKAVERVKTLFGDREGYRLAALASISFDPDRSLVYWLHSLIAYLDDINTDKNSVKAYLIIIKDVADTVKLEFELTPEYIRLLSDLVNELSENLYHIYPEITGSEPPSENPFETFVRLAGSKPSLPASRKVRDIVQPVVQLELFAF